MAFNPLQAQSFSLSGSGSAIGDTVLNLKSFKDINSTNIALADLGTKGYMTLEPGNGTSEEQISFTGVTQNSDGSAQLTGVSTVLFKSPYTETSGMAKTHAGSVTAVLSNTAGFYNQFAILANNEAITGNWTTSTGIPISAGSLAPKAWVLSVVTGGAVSTDQVVVGGTAGENLTQGQIVYLKTDGQWYKASSSATGQALNVMLGIVQATALSGTACSVLIHGVDKTQSGLVAGTTYYMAAGGALSSAVGTINVDLGEALSSTNLQFKPFYTSTVTTPGSAAQGDVVYFNGTNWTRLAAGASGRFLQSGGAGVNPAWGVSERMIAQVITPTTYANDGTVHDIVSFTLKGNTLGSNGIIRFRAFGYGSFLTNGLHPNTFGLYNGATALATIIPAGNNNNNVTGQIEFHLFGNSATNAQLAAGSLMFTNTDTATGTGTLLTSFKTGTGIGTFDSTSDVTLHIQINNDGTNVASSYTINHVTVEQIK